MSYRNKLCMNYLGLLRIVVNVLVDVAFQIGDSSSRHLVLQVHYGKIDKFKSEFALLCYIHIGCFLATIIAFLVFLLIIFTMTYMFYDVDNPKLTDQSGVTMRTTKER